MNAYFTIMPDGQITIELAHETREEEKTLQGLIERGIHTRWFGALGAFEGVEIKLRPDKELSSAPPDTPEIKFTCPGKIEDSRPSRRSSSDGSH